ncbi:MAG: DNA-directed RNA polymerase subunit L [Thermoprotei archaeon]|nr:MAG: DNA-directed RNA polymerase subunit L [Thermoprotei archaeon]
MELKILRENEHELEFILEGEDHTFCNLLVNILLEDPLVEFSAYRIPHPLIRKPIVYVRTRDGSPREAVMRACDKIVALMNELKTKFREALSRHEAGTE